MKLGRYVPFALSFLIVGVAVFRFRETIEFDRTILTTIVLAFGAMAILAFSTQFGIRPSGGALIRLDHFMPFARRKRLRPGKPSFLVTLAHKLLPSSLFFDPETGKEGSIRRCLRKLGPSVLSSPWRRLIQTITFTGFLILFFYVCWPYSAKPAEINPAVARLQFKMIDQDSGELLFENRSTTDIDWTQQLTWHLELPSEASSSAPNSVPVRVEFTQAPALRILPIDPLTPDQFDQILFSDRPLPVYDHSRPFWPSHHTDNLNRKEAIPAELFLIIDPLVSLSTAIASGNWVWSLTAAVGILILCVVIPRGFCGYVCPLGTLIDLFDRLIGQRVQRFRVSGSGWWVHTKYYLLGAVLLTSAFGVLTSGYVAAIPVITRGLLFIGEPVQTAMARGVHLIPPMNAGHLLSIILFFAVLGLGLLRPRFWCKYVCPSGALFSLGNLFRATDRKVESSCIHCNKCVTVCPFDAIKPDFTTRGTDCTQCQTCAGVCPTHSIKFVERWNQVALKTEDQPATHETPIGRRGFLSWAIGSSVAAISAISYTSVNRIVGANLDDPNSVLPVRPPGSVPEEDFLQQCIRCGECFKACPNNVLQPMGFAQGFEGLWTPEVKADWAGCESSCNACGQVCPTGAIRALPLEEKKVARMGLAIVDEQTCLPFAEREACQLCVDECNAAGYEAIEFTYVGTETDADGTPIPDTGYLAPIVIADKCVGCGLCQTRCHGINVEDKGLLKKSAIIIHAGKGREDRLVSGSYQALRAAEEKKRVPETPPELDTFDPFSNVE